MKKVGLIGSSVGESLSYGIHNNAFKNLSLAWEYLPLQTDEENLPGTIERLKRESFAGANVTIPHKTAIISLLDGVSEEAEEIGAVNTLKVREGKVFGSNTDGDGFVADLDEKNIDFSSRQILVLGAGGAARAVTYAILKRGGGPISIWNRSEEKVQTLRKDMGRRFGKASVLHENDRRQWSLKENSLIINCTPCGSGNHEGQMPWPKNCPLNSEQIIVDLIYKNTTFQEFARKCGSEVHDGKGMLVHQAALGFEIWTGIKAPLKAMKTGLLLTGNL